MIIHQTMKVGHDHRDSVEYRELVSAGGIRTVQDPGEDLIAPLLANRRHHQRLRRTAVSCADRANRTELLEMDTVHGPAGLDQPPIMTVGQPGGMISPVGLGIGATQAACSVMSPTRAAGRPQIVTVADPFEMMPGPPGTHPGSMHGLVMSVTRAAG